MPDGANSLPSKESGSKEIAIKQGLAKVDLLSDSERTSRQNSTARFEEYKLDEAEEHDDLASMNGEVEVVRVRRKKKAGKDGKKRTHQG